MQILRETYLEFQQGTSDKFYLLYLADHGGHFETVSIWGRRGSEGKTTILYQGNNRSLADNTWYKLEREKTQKGYQRANMPPSLRSRLQMLTGGNTPPPAPVAPSPLPFVPMQSRSGVTGASLRKAIDAGVYASAPLVTGQRVFCMFEPANGRLSVLDSRGAEQRQIAATLGVNMRNGSKALRDTIIDGTYAQGVFHAADIIRYNGGDVRDYPLAMRDTIVAQALGGLEAAKEVVNGQWRRVDLTPLAPGEKIPTNTTLKDLTSPYDASLREAWLISD
jgi:predicted DNA-binding WGR domain protein